MFKPTRRSIRKHKVPQWYHDVKLGIFVHWGLYSIPAFAEISAKNYHEIQKDSGIESQFYRNPYAEWYQNSLRLKETKTYEYHQKQYGSEFRYEDFAPIFNQEIRKWNPDEMVSIFKQSGAKYVVLVAKHHDGFTLWPSKYPNPYKKNYHASRDIVWELTKAVKKQNLRMGLYYSGKIDWSFEENSINDFVTMLDNEPKQPEYPKYAENHWYELIDTYQPWILWNDIGYPAKSNKLKIFAYFYTKNPEGVINNRWTQIPSIVRWCIRHPIIGKIINNIVFRMITKNKKDSQESREYYLPLYDFSTPEYQVESEIKKYKWETCRGLGSSFGYNKKESEKDYLSPKELIHQLIDVVSKNGNLLINVGPKSDGTIPDFQKKLLLELGNWLKVNGEAIYETRPWKIPQSETKCGIPIRFTSKELTIYIILLGNPQDTTIRLKNLGFNQIKKIEILGMKIELEWKFDKNSLEVNIPNSLPASYAHSFKVSL
ncbi:MAG: alpha-L-fucosidase [Candidatus Lokiarchaeota archaeon]|nr:alpha-L-fucosidase [Candidatus Lokiarchaeota archaeon]